MVKTLLCLLVDFFVHSNENLAYSLEIAFFFFFKLWRIAEVRRPSSPLKDFRNLEIDAFRNGNTKGKKKK